MSKNLIVVSRDNLDNRIFGWRTFYPIRDSGRPHNGM